MANQVGREQGSCSAILSALPVAEASDAAHASAGNSGSAAAVGNQHVQAELPKTTEAELYSGAENLPVRLETPDDAEKDGIWEVAATPGTFSNFAADVSATSAAEESVVIDDAAIAVAAEVQSSFACNYPAEQVSEEVQTSFAETSPVAVSTEAQTSFVAESAAEVQTSFAETSPVAVSTEAQTSFVAESTAEVQTSFAETSPVAVSAEAQTSFVAKASPVAVSAEVQTSFVSEATAEVQTSFVAEATAEVQTSFAEATAEVQTSFAEEPSPAISTEVQTSFVAEVSAEPVAVDSPIPSGGEVESMLPRESHEGDDSKGLEDAFQTAALATKDSNASDQGSQHTNAIADGMITELAQECTEGIDTPFSAKSLVDGEAADSDSDDSFEPTASIINPWSDLTLDTSFEATQDKSQIINRLGPAAARSSLRSSDDFLSPRWTSQQISGKSKEPTAAVTAELHTEVAAASKPGGSSKAAAAAVLAPVNETGASDESTGVVAEPEPEAATGSPEAAPLSPTASTVYLDCETPKSCISSQLSFKSFPSSPWASGNTAPSSPLKATAAVASFEDQQGPFCVKAAEAATTIGTILWCFGLKYKQAVWMLKEPMETVRLCVFDDWDLRSFSARFRN